MVNYTANIFQLDKPYKSGIRYSDHSLLEAVAKFNDRGGFATFEDQYRPAMVDMERIAATVRLRVADGYVKADLAVLDTPMGIIVSQLAEIGLLAVIPDATGTHEIPKLLTHVDTISKLVFVNKSTLSNHSALKVMQAWVQDNIGVDDLFKLVESDK